MDAASFFGVAMLGQEVADPLWIARSLPPATRFQKVRWRRLHGQADALRGYALAQTAVDAC